MDELAKLAQTLHTVQQQTQQTAMAGHEAQQEGVAAMNNLAQAINALAGAIYEVAKNGL